MFTSKWYPAFCTTTYKLQGITVRDHLNIYDASKMTFNQLYTAISRCTKLEHVHIVHDVEKQYKPQKYNQVLKTKCDQTDKFMGKIYQVTFVKDDTFYSYIGQTIRELEERLEEHLTDPNSAVCKQGATDAEINLVGNTFGDKYQLDKLERIMILKDVKVQDDKEDAVNINAVHNPNRKQKKKKDEKPKPIKVQTVKPLIRIQKSLKSKSYFVEKTINGKMI
eukprot:TRINITY_DN13860_c0_g1_i4.p1 TRINITY_DN13860_c0_g1~~TRINITY_DN13860_c0_g1_i4.p1  ORF type:complete len:238 (-),score=34.61 TRINITY_DN13860_c0_g1_i4:861-1526(-)